MFYIRVTVSDTDIEHVVEASEAHKKPHQDRLDTLRLKVLLYL